MVTKGTTVNYDIDSFAIVALTPHVYHCHTKMQLDVNDSYYIHSKNTKLTSKLEKMYIEAENLLINTLGQKFI